MTDTGKLSDGEFRVMLRLLQRYADHDLDQWQLWRLPSGYGDLFVSLRRSPEPGIAVEVYDDATGFLTSE